MQAHKDVSPRHHRMHCAAPVFRVRPNRARAHNPPRPVPAAWLMRCSGVRVRQNLLQPRFGKACDCPRCREDWGQPPEEQKETHSDYRVYGAGGEKVKCQKAGCAGYVLFPCVELEDATSEKCPLCGETVARAGGCPFLI